MPPQGGEEESNEKKISEYMIDNFYDESTEPKQKETIVYTRTETLET